MTATTVVPVGYEVLVGAGYSLGQAVLRLGGRVVTAESCTAGLIAAALTEVAGSSDWFDRGFATYSNEAKRELLGVAAASLEAHGAVSEAVAAEMAAGALARGGLQAMLSLAVSGVAGPGGGTPARPVGTVCFGWAFRLPGSIDSSPVIEVATRHFDGDRRAVRFAAARFALVDGQARLGRQLADRPPAA